MKKVMSIVIAILVVAALASNAFATPDSAPSPSNSPSLLVPTIIGAVVYDAEGNVVEEGFGDEIVITPYALKDDAVESTRIALEEAYDNLVAAGSVEAVCPEFAGMAVRDVLHFAAPERIAAILANGGTMVLSFDLQMDADAQMEAMHFDAAAWSACPAETMTVYANGDVDMALNALGVFAFLVA